MPDQADNNSELIEAVARAMNPSMLEQAERAIEVATPLIEKALLEELFDEAKRFGEEHGSNHAAFVVRWFAKERGLDLKGGG